MTFSSRIKSQINSTLRNFGIEILRIENTTRFKDFVLERNLVAARGVLHIGAHFGEERFIYSELQKPTLWVEAVPEYYNQLRFNIEDIDNQEARLFLLSDDERVVDFYIASNDGASSSLYELAEKSGFEKTGLKMEASVQLKTIRLDKALSKEDFLKFDHWVVDVQGAELAVLKGAGEFFIYCNSIQVEVSRREIYVGGTKYAELVDFFNQRGFVQIWEAHTGEHMDVLFIRRNSLID
jgi:FkbM family methyltransferase